MNVVWVAKDAAKVGRDLERRVLGRFVLGACGRCESERSGWANFSDAPSLVSARSMQQKRGASRKENCQWQCVEEVHAHTAGSDGLGAMATTSRGTRFVVGLSRAFVCGEPNCRWWYSGVETSHRGRLLWL